MVVFERAAKALIRRTSDGKYLILTCSLWPENPRRSQKPDLPGGVIEPHEQIEAGLLREVREETGLELTFDHVKLAHCHTYLDDNESSSFLAYVAEVEGDPVITLSWEHESYEWLTAEQVLSLDIRQPYRDIFEYIASIGLLR